MKAVIQRVKYATVKVDNKIIGECKQGFMILLGVIDGDTENDADKLIKKIDEENIQNVDIYYSKSGKMLVCRGNKKKDSESLEPIDIGNDTYIVNSGGNIKILKGTDSFSEWSGTKTVNSWYGDGFVNAQKDTTYKDYIYFENLEDLKNIVK